MSNNAASGISSLQLWSNIVQTPDVVEYFKDVFGKAGVTVEETGEQFTVTNYNDRFTLHAGIDPDVELLVPLKAENITNLVQHAADGKFDAQESWRIVQVLFTPLTRAALQSPVVKQNWLRVLAGVESVIHVHLLHPNGGDAVTHTLVYAGHQWLVISGLHGTPERTYKLTAEDALAFQRNLYRALKGEGMSGWWQFAGWYREWRTAVSSTP
jgi:hypothetical protein